MADRETDNRLLFVLLLFFSPVGIDAGLGFRRAADGATSRFDGKSRGKGQIEPFNHGRRRHGQTSPSVKIGHLKDIVSVAACVEVIE